MELKEDISKLPALFERVRRQLDIETAMDLDSISDGGELSEPGYGRLHIFNNKITGLLNEEAKLYGIDTTNEMVTPVLFKLFVESWPDFNESDLIKGITPSNFVVGSPENPLPFVAIGIGCICGISVYSKPSLFFGSLSSNRLIINPIMIKIPTTVNCHHVTICSRIKLVIILHQKR